MSKKLLLKVLRSFQDILQMTLMKSILQKGRGILAEMRAKIKGTGWKRRKITEMLRCNVAYWVIEGQGAHWRTEQKMIKWIRNGERDGMATEEGSDLEQADREKMTALVTRGQLFSEVHWSCGEVISAKGNRQTDRQTEEQADRQTSSSLSSFSLFPLSRSLCVFICTPLWTGTLGRLQGMGLNFKQHRLS